VGNGADRTEVAPSGKIGSCVRRFCSRKNRGAEIGVAPWGEFSSRTRRVAAVAVAHYIDDAASQSNERAVLPLHVQWHGGYIETTLNQGFLTLITGFGLTGSDSPRTMHQE
jgi:hypothetical protein